jgi:hypothetical protein
MHEGRRGVIELRCDLVEPPEHFHLQLRDLTISTARHNEGGARLLVGHYLSHAILLSRDQDCRLALYADVDIEPLPVSRVGLLTGTLDFAVVQTEGDGSIGISSCL